MKVAAYTCLHYGKEYLGYAIKGFIDHVDKYIVVYSPEPSHGTATNIPCPDTEEELKAIAEKEAGDKLEWVRVTGVHQENAHRQLAFQFVDSSFDLMAVVDYDEVWSPKKFKEACSYAMECQARNVGVNGISWVTLWKSFNEYVTDGFAPIRFHNLRAKNNYQNLDCRGEIYHFGYCISDEIMNYKKQIHGHQDWKPFWYNDIWLNYKKGETTHLHPCTNSYWVETQEFDKARLPKFMREHPRYSENSLT